MPVMPNREPPRTNDWREIQEWVREVTNIKDKTTDDLTEGTTNIYFTPERVDDEVNNLLQAGNALTKTYDDITNILTLDVDKAVSVSPASPSSVSVVTPDAGAVYGANEQTLINEMKGDINTLTADLNAAITVLNNLITSLKNGGFVNV